ncbi:MAG TPA: hypothetical protein VLZ54_08950, partial [Arenibacter sp.]|nr:hypothetical protein [Arenibacter sp.]
MFKNKYRIVSFLLLYFSSRTSFSQEVVPERYTESNKNKIYVYWGGNRGYFTRSDIHFRGNDYDFVLNDVKAQDKPKGWHIDYINPTRITIPQTNFRVGYFLTDHYNISLGMDHMKYVMVQDQVANISGAIDIPGSLYSGHYQNEPIVLAPEFLMFEHTDGLNYINIEFSRVDDIGKYFLSWNPDHFQLNLTEGIGAGILYPKTNTTLLGKDRYDNFHISGYGLSAKAGLNITFLKYFFVQAELKGGYIN